jgi:WD40 repeat protein
LAVCTSEGLQIWDAAALAFITTFKPEDSSKYRVCSFSQDNCYLAAGTTNGNLSVFDVTDFTFKLIASVKPDGSSKPILECLFVEPSNILCAIGNSCRIYELGNLIQKSESVAIHPGVANASIVLPHKEAAITLGAKTLRLWDTETYTLLASGTGTVGGYLLRLSADGKRLLTYGDRCYIEVWDVDSLHKTKDLIHMKQRNLPIGMDEPDESSPTDICHCAVSVDGVVVGGNGNGDLFVWYGEELEFVKELEMHESLITFVEFSPSGSTFVSADMDGVVMMWQLSNERDANFKVNMMPLTCHTDSVEQISYSSRGRRLASCSMDESVHLYNGPSGDLIAKLTNHSTGVMKVIFSANESLIASGDEKGEIIIWDGITGQLLQHIKPRIERIILDLQFVKQDKYICSRDNSAGFITVYDVNTGGEASRLNFTTEIFSMSASSFWEDKSSLVCCLKDSSVKFVNVLDFDPLHIIG